MDVEVIWRSPQHHTEASASAEIAHVCHMPPAMSDQVAGAPPAVDTSAGTPWSF